MLGVGFESRDEGMGYGICGLRVDGGIGWGLIVFVVVLYDNIGGWGFGVFGVFIGVVVFEGIFCEIEYVGGYGCYVVMGICIYCW